MADAVLGSVNNTLDIVFKIKNAVDTVKRNEKDCQQMKRLVERVEHTLLLCQKGAELMNSEWSRCSLEALSDVLVDALELVVSSQEETGMCCLLMEAGQVFKKLNRVDQRISSINYEVSFAIMVCMAPNTKSLTHYQVPDGHGHSLQLDEHTKSVPHTISEVAVKIKVALDKVQRNNAECIEIEKRVNGFNVFLSQSGNTVLMKDPSMRASVEKLHTVFFIALKLVMDCQKRNIICIRSGRRLYKELHEVLDQIDLALDEMITISANYACTM